MSHLDNLKVRLGQGGVAEAVIISSEINQRYISNFPFQDGYVLVTREKSYLVTDFRYTEAARAGADRGLEVVAPEGGMLTYIAGKLNEHKIKTVAYEEATLPCALLERFKTFMPSVEFVSGASKLLDGLREFKDADEIRYTAEAQDIADAAFEHIVKFIRPNMTEIEVSLELEFFMRKNGAEAAAFETIAVSGTASSMPHGVPRNVQLEKGFLTMDYGARVNGYCSDMTRTVVIGKADEEMVRLYNTVLRAQLAALEVIAGGVNNRSVDKVARDIINAAGYEGCFGHGLGHGVGMYIHEAPRLSQGAAEDAVLTTGQIVTVEPGIYIEGKYGCRIEDMVCITPDSYINFTHSPKELIEII